MNLDALAEKIIRNNCLKVGGVVHASIRAALAQAYEMGLEEAAKSIDPKSDKPCDCINDTKEGVFVNICLCGNAGDLDRVSDWCARKNGANAIRAMKGEPR